MGAMPGPLEFLFHAASEHGHRTAVRCGGSGYDYGSLYDRCARLANALTGIGIRPGDRVAVFSPNCHRLLEAYFGVPALRAILVPLNIRLHPEELAWILSDCSPRAVLLDRSLASEWSSINVSGRPVERVLAWADPVDISSPLTGAHDYDVALEAANPDFPALDLRENDPAELFYTSGTTRRPKGVVLTHGNLYAHARAVRAALPLSADDAHLHSISLYHANGWGAPHTVTAAGARHVILRRFEPSEVFRLLVTEQVTEMFLVPTMANMLLESLPPTDSIPALAAEGTPGRSGPAQPLQTNLRRIVVGGGATNPHQIRRLEERFGCRSIASYGLTEASPVVVFTTDKEGAWRDEESRIRWQARAGVPIPGVSLRVTNADGTPITPDDQEVGEVQLAGPTISPRYWNEAAVGDDPRTPDGWFRTGDLATIDALGSIRIVDRAKELIRSGSLSISSIEVEAVLATHPAVLECAVVGVPDPHWGEAPQAFVVLRKGAAASARELATHCRAHLARFKVPHGFTFTSALPKSGTGKILKRHLLPGTASEQLLSQSS